MSSDHEDTQYSGTACTHSTVLQPAHTVQWYSLHTQYSGTVCTHSTVVQSVHTPILTNVNCGDLCFIWSLWGLLLHGLQLWGLGNLFLLWGHTVWDRTHDPELWGHEIIVFLWGLHFTHLTHSLHNLLWDFCVSVLNSGPHYYCNGLFVCVNIRSPFPLQRFICVC